MENIGEKIAAETDIEKKIGEEPIFSYSNHPLFPPKNKIST